MGTRRRRRDLRKTEAGAASGREMRGKSIAVERQSSFPSSAPLEERQSLRRRLRRQREREREGDSGCRGEEVPLREECVKEGREVEERE